MKWKIENEKMLISTTVSEKNWIESSVVLKEMQWHQFIKNGSADPQTNKCRKIIHEQINYLSDPLYVLT